MTDDQLDRLMTSLRPAAGAEVVPGPDCPPLPRLASELKSGMSPQLEAHLERCAYCQRTLDHLADAEAEPAQPPPALWGMAYSARPLARIPADEQARTYLRFEDAPALLATLSRAEGKHRLTITHDELPPGSLLRVRVEGGEAPDWSRFVVLRPAFGDGPPMARLDAEAALPSAAPRLFEVDFASTTGRFAAEDAEALRTSFDAMLRDDPLAAPAWGQWATAVLAAGEQPERVRTVLREIAGRGAKAAARERSGSFLRNSGLLALAAVVLVALVFGLVYAFRGPRPADEGALLAGLHPVAPPWRSGDKPPTLRREGDRWLLKANSPFQVELKSPRQGHAAVVVLTDQGRKVYPLEDQDPIGVPERAAISYGPILPPRGATQLQVLVLITPKDRSAEVRALVNDLPAGEAEGARALAELARRLRAGGSAWVAADALTIHVIP